MALREHQANQRSKQENKNVKYGDANDSWKANVPGFIIAPNRTVLTNKLVEIVMDNLKVIEQSSTKLEGAEKQKTGPLKIVVVTRSYGRARELYGLIDKERPMANTINKLTDTNTQDVLICNKFDVVVVTPNFFEHCLEKSYVKMNEFPLILFDECLQRSKQDPYRKIRHEYLKLKSRKKRDSKISVPKIIGLTSKIYLDNVLDDNSIVCQLQTLCAMWDSMSIQYIKTDNYNLKQLKNLKFPELEILIKEIMQDLEKQLQSIAKTKSCPKKLSQRVIKKHDMDDEFYGRWLTNIRTCAEHSKYASCSEVKQIASIIDCLQECYWTLVSCKFLMPEEVIKRFVEYMKKKSEVDCSVLSDLFSADLKLVAAEITSNENFNSLVELLNKKEATKVLVLVENERVAVLLTSCLEMSGIKDIKTVLKDSLKAVGGHFKDELVKYVITTENIHEQIMLPDGTSVIYYNHKPSGKIDCEDPCKVEVLCLEKMFHEIVTRETINERIEKAVKVVNYRKFSIIQRLNTEFQEKLRNKIEDVVELDVCTPVKQSSNNDVDAKMICSHCGKLQINLDQVRVYKETTIICFDNNFFENHLEETDNKITDDDSKNDDIVKTNFPKSDDKNDQRDKININENKPNTLCKKSAYENKEGDKKNNVKKNEKISENNVQTPHIKSGDDDEVKDIGYYDRINKNTNLPKCIEMKDKNLEVRSQHLNIIEDPTHVKQKKSYGNVTISNDEELPKEKFTKEMEVYFFRDWTSLCSEPGELNFSLVNTPFPSAQISMDHDNK